MMLIATFLPLLALYGGFAPLALGAKCAICPDTIFSPGPPVTNWFQRELWDGQNIIACE